MWRRNVKFDCCWKPKKAVLLIQRPRQELRRLAWRWQGTLARGAHLMFLLVPFPRPRSPPLGCLYRSCIFIKEHYHGVLQQIERERNWKNKGGGDNKKKQPKPPFSRLPSMSMLQSRACVHLVDGPNPERFAKAQIKREKDLTHHFLWFLKNLSYMARALQIQSNPFFPPVCRLRHAIRSELFSWLTGTVDHHSQLCSFLHIWYKEKKKKIKNPYSSFMKTQAHTQ